MLIVKRIVLALPLITHVFTLLVWGDRDRAMSLKSGVRLRQVMTASEPTVIPGGGHVVFEELPEETNLVVVEWQKRNLGSSNHPDQVQTTHPCARDQTSARSLTIRAVMSPAIGHAEPET